MGHLKVFSQFFVAELFEDHPLRAAPAAHPYLKISVWSAVALAAAQFSCIATTITTTKKRLQEHYYAKFAKELGTRREQFDCSFAGDQEERREICSYRLIVLKQQSEYTAACRIF